MDRRIFGWENIYSVLHMDRWIFDDILKIYKSTRNCKWIGGFLWMLLVKYTNLQGFAPYVLSAPTDTLFLL